MASVPTVHQSLQRSAQRDVSDNLRQRTRVSVILSRHRFAPSQNKKDGESKKKERGTKGHDKLHVISERKKTTAVSL